MTGPPLTPHEAVAAVARRVRRHHSEGYNREQAIQRTAFETGLRPEKVCWCVETAGGEPPVRLLPRARRRLGAPATAAVL